MADNDAFQIKLVVAGDGAIGKTCLLIGYEKDEFPTDYLPTVFENVTLEKEMMINGQTSLIGLDLWDTAGQEDFDRLRHLAYRETDIFLMCFSVVEHTSFMNLQSSWLPEAQNHRPDALIILVGLKCDLRNNEDIIKKYGKDIGISQESIEEYRKSCGAAAYVETSALKKINIEKAFETAITLFLDPNHAETDETNGPKESDGCCVII
eukprot:402836_1